MKPTQENIEESYNRLPSSDHPSSKDIRLICDKLYIDGHGQKLYVFDDKVNHNEIHHRIRNIDGIKNAVLVSSLPVVDSSILQDEKLIYPNENNSDYHTNSFYNQDQEWQSATLGFVNEEGL